MKILFISSRDVMLKFQGGPQCTNRNYESFCSLIGKHSVDVINLNLQKKISIKNKFVKRLNLLQGFYWGLNKKKVDQIIEKAKDYELVFIDSSFYGVLIYYLKNSGFQGKIICHFHNAEIVLRIEKTKRKPWRFWEVLIMYYNEKKAFKYADELVVLNQRDKEVLQRFYGKRTMKIIPISMIDSYPDQIQEKTLISEPPVLLFIGGDHYANYHGIKWFIKNILDLVNIRLQIVGKGMEILNEEISHPKLEILGYVPHLSDVIISADFIVSPVFKGGGMKVKTCEALMYGKNILGTKESFEGYEINPTKVGALCNSKEEFIATIQTITNRFKKRFNGYSRQCYKEKYSFQATLEKFKALISELDHP